MGEYTNALVSALQGASNAAASNVSGPVDLISWALRKAGVPVPSNPVLGSEWMRQKGLLAEPQNKLFGLLGESAGLSAPIAASAKAPQIARGLLNVADDFQAYNKALGPAGVSQATVWHGSPHKFDKFDSSKIGTGEGAQAYGHGLYLADSPGVANTYKLAGADAVNLVGRDGGAINLAALPPPLQKALNANAGAPDLLGNARRFLANKTNQNYYAEKYGATSVGDAVKVLDDLSAAGVSVKDPGNLYKVDLPDTTIARMLDWDKPLSQQAPEVQKWAMEQVQKPGDPYNLQRYFNPKNPNGGPLGQDLYRAVQGSGSQGAVSDLLRQQGIPGIRYLDGGSRGAGAGTSNYVVFPGEESALTILERNGSPVNALVKALQGPR